MFLSLVIDECLFTLNNLYCQKITFKKIALCGSEISVIRTLDTVIWGSIFFNTNSIFMILPR